MRDYVVEVEWVTQAGLRAVCLRTSMHRCGYVEIPEDHPCFGAGYDAELLRDVSVHGGLTYANGQDEYPVPGTYWFGFDCGHGGDGSFEARFNFGNYPVRSDKYVIEQCEMLAAQLVNIKG